MVRATNSLTLPVRFQGMGTTPRSTANAFLRTFDFDQLGKSTVKQNMVIYALVIASRLMAATVRGQEIGSFNEVREHAVRDFLGWTFWFFAAGKIQRLFLRFAPERYRKALVDNPYHAPAKAPEGSWAKFTERFKKEYSFIAKGRIPTAEQVENRMTQMLKHAREAAKAQGEGAVKLAEADVKNYFGKLARFRSFASGVGIVLAIALLGIGIPLVNIIMTRQKVAEREAKKHETPQNYSAGMPMPVAPNAFSFSGGADSQAQTNGRYVPPYLR